MICRDTFVTLGLAARETSRMQLFPAVTNPFTRHASVLASACLPNVEIPQPVREIYPDLAHAADWEAAIAATSFVPDEVVGRICDAIGLIGTPEDCARRIIETASLGVRDIYLMPLQSFALPKAEVRAFGDVVSPRLREAGLRAG